MTSDQLELEYEQAPSLEEKKNVLGKIAEACIKNFLDETDERTKLEELFENLRDDFLQEISEDYDTIRKEFYEGKSDKNFVTLEKARKLKFQIWILKVVFMDSISILLRTRY